MQCYGFVIVSLKNIAQSPLSKMVANCHLEFDGFDNFSVKTLRKVFESNAFPDVTLVGDDKLPLEAHRIILSAHSSVFENAFTECQSRTRTLLYCKGFNYQDLHSLMQYMYLGQVSVPLAQTNELIKMAKYLKISQLGEECNVSENKLNRIFSLIPKEIDYNSELNTANDTDDGELNFHSKSEVLNLKYEDDLDQDETFNSAYDSFEDVVDTDNIINIGYEKNTHTNDGMHGGKKRNRDIKSNIEEATFEAVENDYGPDMVGKPLPGYALQRSVTYSHYYFVKMKPVDGITYARCNLCWFKIGQPADYTKSQSKGFLKISGFNKTQPTSSSTTTCLIKHLGYRHPDIMEQYLKQNVENSILQQKFKETERNIKFKPEMNIMRRKEKKKNLCEKSPDYDYDFENIDEDIRTITVGEPKVDFNPCESVVFSHNYFRKLYPRMVENTVKYSTSHAMCIPCAKNNEKLILRTPGGTTSSAIKHIERKHPDLWKQFQEQAKLKSMAVQHRGTKK